MNDFSSSQVIEGRWDLMCRRLESLLGDVAELLGSRWFVTLERLFSEADLDAAAVLRGGSLPHPDWFVMRYTEAGRRIDGEETGIVCAPSQQAAIASLLAACESARFMPTKVVHDSAQRSWQLFAGQALLVTVSPLIVKEVSAKLRARAFGTLKCLRAAKNPAVEFLKRLRRWPHLAQVQQDEELDADSVLAMLERMAHLPCPAEWLLSARMLCKACGLVKPDSAFIEKVAAAALGAPSWNHLAGSFEVRRMGLMQPWSVHGEANAYGEVYGCYADGFDALADAAIRLPHEFVTGWESVSFRSTPGFSLTDYLPTFGFRERFLDGNRSPIESFGDSIWISPIVRAQAPERDAIERVERALSEGDDAIAALFGAKVAGDVRARLMDERSGETLVAQDGPWRVVRTGDPMKHGTYLFVYRVDENSNAMAAAAVPTYKGLLQTHRRTGHHVLCSDYDGKMPVAVLKGLSPTAVALIRANLPSTSESVMEFAEEPKWGENKRAFAEIMKSLSS